MNVTIPLLVVCAVAFIVAPFVHARAATVIQQPVSTGNVALDKQIEEFYKCVSDTHKDPPSIAKTDACFFDNVHSGLAHGFIFVGPFASHIITSFNFHHHIHFSHFGHGLRSLIHN